MQQDARTRCSSQISSDCMSAQAIAGVVESVRQFQNSRAAHVAAEAGRIYDASQVKLQTGQRKKTDDSQMSEFLSQAPRPCKTRGALQHEPGFI